MKFRFCGDLDCPDWVLAEIATLSRITSIKIKFLCNQVVNGILGTAIDFDKVAKLTADAKYDTSDVKATISALSFIFTSSAKHAIDEESLLNELQQLGLPKESTSALCKIFSEKFALLQEKLTNDTFKLTEIQNISWQVDHILWSSVLKEVNKPSIKLFFEMTDHTSHERKMKSFDLSCSKFQLLLHELKQACCIMDEVTPS